MVDYGQTQIIFDKTFDANFSKKTLLVVFGEVNPEKCDGFHSNFEDCKLWKKFTDQEAAVISFFYILFNRKFFNCLFRRSE
jgi:hypothetical protein